MVRLVDSVHFDSCRDFDKVVLVGSSSSNKIRCNFFFAGDILVVVFTLVVVAVVFV